MNIRNLFILSVTLEQIVFLYLNLFSITILGARLIQLLIIFYIILFKPKLISINLGKIDKISFYFFIFLFLGFIVAIYNLINGSYLRAFSQEVEMNVFFNDVLFRILRETTVYLYFYFIFVFLFNRMINTPETLRDFFVFFRKVFLLSIYIGFFLYLYYFIYERNLIPRQLNYGFENVYDTRLGLRFKGLFGEPRDAAVCLMIGLGILTFEQIHLMNSRFIRSFKNTYIFNTIIVFIAFFLTNSGTALIAISIFFTLFSISLFFFIKINLRTIIILIVGILFLILILSGSRTEIYYNEILNLPLLMSGKINHTINIGYQLNNILPIWLVYENIINLNIFSVLLGNGFGSSAYISYAQLRIDYVDLFANPHAQLTRIIFENGLLGSLLWYLFYLVPLLRFRNILNRKYFIILFSISTLSFSAILAHRNPEMFLLLGVMISVFKQYSENQAHLKD
tara:strand:+ start:236 stop:1594 length:1359 start_codon:yes stop_codon:yes gene_type:complete